MTTPVPRAAPATASAWATSLVLDPGALEAMTTPTPGAEYGLGLTVTQTPFGTVMGHHGYIPGYVSEMWYVPSIDTVVVALANADRAEPIDAALALLQSLDSP